MKSERVAALVLAAGKGTRMKSENAKVLHEVFFAPMVHHVLDALLPLQLAEINVVTGHQREAVESSLKKYPVQFAVQEMQDGTGHAVLSAQSLFAGKKSTVLILCGDTPLIRTETLRKMVGEHLESDALLTVMTTVLEDPTHYGRAIVNGEGDLVRIVEEKDASDAERVVQEVNAGIYCVAADFLFKVLQDVGSNNKQGEVYLTDIVALANRAGHGVKRFVCHDPEEVLGVNSRVELAQAHQALQQRRNRDLMLAGVTLLQPESVFVEKNVSIAPDTVISPNVSITGHTTIGKSCVIGPNVVIHNSCIKDQAVIPPFSHLVGEANLP